MFSETIKKKLRILAIDKNIEPACLMAVVQVESGGKFAALINGKKEPLIRFEGHYFYRLLPKAKRNKAVVAGLANARAGRVRNPFSQKGRWALVARASNIDRPAALASVSWGVGQVMGIHWRWLGYGSIDALVHDARSGLEGQVRLMTRFIQKAGLLEKLASHDWAGFARAYNGPGYRRNKYHIKMAKAYRQYSALEHNNGTNNKFRRTSHRHSVAMLRMGSTGSSVLELQNQLGILGYHLARDGDFGPATEKTVKQFQRTNRLISDGIVGPKTFEMLMRKMPAQAL